MSMEPIQRRMQNPAAGAINVPVNLVDQVTTLTFIQLGQPNTILDMYNAVDPAGTATYEYGLDKNSISTGRTFFSNAMFSRKSCCRTFANKFWTASNDWNTHYSLSTNRRSKHSN